MSDGLKYAIAISTVAIGMGTSFYGMGAGDALSWGVTFLTAGGFGLYALVSGKL